MSEHFLTMKKIWHSELQWKKEYSKELLVRKKDKNLNLTYFKASLESANLGYTNISPKPWLQKSLLEPFFWGQKDKISFAKTEFLHLSLKSARFFRRFLFQFKFGQFFVNARQSG